MDTKSKKSHKLTTIIITLCILLPAFIITSLYPKISSAMERSKEKKYEEYKEGHGHVGPEWEVDEKFLNYAMEASYYVYGILLQEATEESVDFRVLDWSGWVTDYNYVAEVFGYSATYNYNGQTTGVEKGNFGHYEDIGYLTFEFDEKGNLAGNIQIEEAGENTIWVPNNDDYDLHFVAMESVEQYERNVRTYESANNVDINEEQLKPKNFKITFALREDWQNDMVWLCDYFYYSTEGLLFDVGGVWIMLAAILFVAFMALILPFFKGLHTGWEKLFSIPFEFVICLAVGAVGAFYGMFYAMGATCMLKEFPTFGIIDIVVGQNVSYGALLALNMLGWAICFFLEYIVIASIRQLIAKPIYYLKHRILIVIILRWLKNQCMKVYARLTQIDMKEKCNKYIFMIVLVNFAIIAGASSLLFLVASALFYFDDFVFVMWIFTIITLVIYSILLYVFLFKFAEKLQKQYDSVLNATSQMASGNLKIKLESDLGVFEPLGNSLEKIQQGFEKAVVEEAKSQNMKTELITNVSHDLKTPLTAIITYVDLLKQEDITVEEQKTYIDTLDKKSQRLKVLIEDLFEVSKAQSGNVHMNFMDVDVVSLMKQVRSEMSEQFEASNLTFRWGLPEEKILLSLDGQRTYRVFENLLNNALKYAMPYSRVFVDVVDLGSQVKVIFRNTSALELDFNPERLTERFVRGDASRQSEGSGLGLAIAKSFVELQNGQFTIEVDGDLFKVILVWNK